MYIKKEYRSFITEVYQNKDWRLFPDARIHQIADEYVEERPKNLLFTPDHFDGESTWDESTGRLRLNRDYNTATYYEYYYFMQIFTNVLPHYCEDDRMCFYAGYDYCSNVDETVIYDLKNKREAKVNYILEKLCDDISEYEKLSDQWTDIDEDWYTSPISLTKDEDALTARYILYCRVLKRATKEELELFSPTDSIIRPIDLDELVDENGTFDIPEWITSIGPYTFKNIAGLKRIIFRHRYLTIDKYAFAGCVDLEEVIFPEKPKDYNYFSAYDTLVKIKEGAFSGCLKLKRIQLPKWLEHIDPFTFFGCVNLEEVVMPASTEERIKLARSRGIDIDNAGYTLRDIYSAPCRITSHAFALCRSLKRISLPQDMTVIDTAAFYKCTSLKDISLPSKLREIGNEAFCGCASFKRIDIPKGTHSVGEGAFNDCTALCEITIPPSVIIMGRDEASDRSIIAELSGHILHNTMLEKGELGYYDYQFRPLVGVTIRCAENSAAEFYARYNKINFEIYDI